MLTAAAINKQASDEALQNTTTKAMQALMDIAAQKPGRRGNQWLRRLRPQYRNSQDLDIARLKKCRYR